MVPLIREKKATWLDYSMACADDEPIEGAVAVVRFLHQMMVWTGLTTAKPLMQFGVSGRNASAEDITRDWLKRHQVPLDDVFLRADDDYTENGQLKVKVIGQLRARGYDVVLFIDDWQEAADTIQAATGVPVLVVKGLYTEDVEGSV